MSNFKKLTAVILTIALLSMNFVTVFAIDGSPKNLALNKSNFTISMIGEGTDYDPGTQNITIKEKEPQIISRLTDGVYANGMILNGA